jgi:hypothetical protein
MGLYRIEGAHGAYLLDISSRDEGALRQLLLAGAKGCTPIDNPAPRWSAYVHKLRRRGLDIETIDERHGGAFPGRHARYVLHSSVLALEAQDGEAA